MGKRRLPLFYRMAIISGFLFVITLLLSILLSILPFRSIFVVFVIIAISSALSTLIFGLIGFMDSRYSRSLETDLYAYMAMLKGFRFDPLNGNHILGVVICVFALFYFFFLFAYFFDWGKSCSGSDECCLIPGAFLISIGTGMIFKDHFRDRKNDLYYIHCMECGTFTPIVTDGKVSTIKCRDCGRKEALDPSMDRMEGRKLRTCPKCGVRTFMFKGSTCPYCRNPFSKKKMEENEKMNIKTFKFEKSITIEKKI